MKERFIVWCAQGFGSGKFPITPGTGGSLVGLLWFAVLVASGSPIVFCIGALIGIPISIYLCGAAEKILNLKDPGSIVMDEIIAVPICFAAWLGILVYRGKGWPSPEYFFTAPNWSMTLAVFILFRIADIAKPWPVRQSQNLPGGIGVTMDDVLAAIYVNAVIVLAWWLKPEWF